MVIAILYDGLVVVLCADTGGAGSPEKIHSAFI